MTPPRLMAITSGPSGPLFLDWLDELVDDGVDAVHVRDKHLADGELLRLTAAVVERCAGRLTVLVNGRPDVAVAAGADGVHLPSRGLPTSAVRRAFPQLLVGRSTHHPSEIADAARDGAHYVTFGPVRATPSKERYGPPQGLAALRRAVSGGRAAGERLPVLALGGLDGSDAESVRQAGAWGLAGIRVFQSGATRRDLVRAWRQADPPWPDPDGPDPDGPDPGKSGP